MTSRYSGSSIFAQAINGLTSNYYYLSMGTDGKGLSLDNIIHPSDDVRKSAYYNYNFSSYMARNFTKMDLDGDGLISENDLTNYTSQMCTTGLTYNQLVQLCGQTGTSSLLETVLNNFNDVDKNGDGRITNSEICAYQIDKEADEVKEKYPKFDMKGMSIMYDTSSVQSTSSSEKS